LCCPPHVSSRGGVFTFTSLRYDDGRRDLHLPLSTHFRERVREYNRVVFDNGEMHTALCADIKEVSPEGFDLVYLDPPYAPPRDDNCYIKRYHFLEGLSVYWRGLEIMQQTQTKKLVKRFTPFSYKHTIADALSNTFERFRDSVIVLSYSSNAVHRPRHRRCLVARGEGHRRRPPSRASLLFRHSRGCQAAAPPTNISSSGIDVSADLVETARLHGVI